MTAPKGEGTATPPEDLAETVADGFARMDERFTHLEERFGRVEARLEKLDSKHDRLLYGLLAAAIAIIITHVF